MRDEKEIPQEIAPAVADLRNLDVEHGAFLVVLVRPEDGQHTAMLATEGSLGSGCNLNDMDALDRGLVQAHRLIRQKRAELSAKALLSDIILHGGNHEDYRGRDGAGH